MPKKLRRRVVRWFMPTFTVGALCVVHDESGRLLLVRHSYRRGWGIPGGMLKYGEAPAEAGRRELFEELGLRVRVLGRAVPMVLPGHRRVDLIFRAAPVSGSSAQALSAEIVEVGWFEPHRLPRLDMTAQLVLNELENACPAPTPGGTPRPDHEQPRTH